MTVTDGIAVQDGGLVALFTHGAKVLQDGAFVAPFEHTVIDDTQAPA